MHATDAHRLPVPEDGGFLDELDDEDLASLAYTVDTSGSDVATGGVPTGESGSTQRDEWRVAVRKRCTGDPNAAMRAMAAVVKKSRKSGA